MKSFHKVKQMSFPLLIQKSKRNPTAGAGKPLISSELILSEVEFC